MGLDMYLNRMPRYKNATAKEVSMLEDYFDWKNKKKDPNSSANSCTLKKWCGVEYKDVPNGNIRKFYEPFFTVKYSEWDIEKSYGYGRIMDQVAYWRKANAIHDWFVNHVQDGEDDCDYHDEVTKETLQELLDVCEQVLKASEMVDGQIVNGYRYTDNGKEPILEDGQHIKDPSVAMELLPTTGGFFFGSTDYDEWYYEQVEYTANKIREILETTDFEQEMIYYVSSW